VRVAVQHHCRTERIASATVWALLSAVRVCERNRAAAFASGIQNAPVQLNGAASSLCIELGAATAREAINVQCEVADQERRAGVLDRSD
jgi:hypothetical protein